VSVKLASVERFLRVGRNDEAHLAFEIDADLTSVFSWNTKQLFVWVAAEYTTPHNPGGSSVSVWDRTVENKADAHLQLPFVRNKYKLVDDGTGLRGKSVNLTMGWQIMPRVGVMMKGHTTVPHAFTLPEEYPEPPQQHARRTGVYTQPPRHRGTDGRP
jgi:signal peptidase complex subunit 3